MPIPALSGTNLHVRMSGKNKPFYMSATNIP